MRTRAWWKHRLIAESEDVVLADGRHWFPARDVRFEYLRESQTRVPTPGVGEARYWHVVVDGDLKADAAIAHPDPAPAHADVRGRIAFGDGVEIERVA